MHSLKSGLTLGSLPGLSRRNRWIAGLIAVVLLSMLGTARSLTPSPNGMGTHRQLGLPPCSMVVWMGARCPSCGMTTSWAHFTRGSWVQSVRANAAGFLLAVVSAACSIAAIFTVISGQAPSYRWQWGLCLALISIFVIAMVEWGVRLLS
jgi:Protein of unknown function (DUF2752)